MNSVELQENAYCVQRNFDFDTNLRLQHFFFDNLKCIESCFYIILGYSKIFDFLDLYLDITVFITDFYSIFNYNQYYSGNTKCIIYL